MNKNLTWEHIEEVEIPAICNAHNPRKLLIDIHDDVTKTFIENGFDPADSTFLDSIKTAIEAIEAYI